MLKIKKIFETKKSLFGFSSFHLMKHQNKLNIIKEAHSVRTGSVSVKSVNDTLSIKQLSYMKLYCAAGPSTVKYPT